MILLVDWVHTSEDLMMPSSPQWKAYRETEPDHGTQRKVTLCRKLSKYAVIFLFLAVFGLIFLLHNISTIEVRREGATPRFFSQLLERTKDIPMI